MTKAAGTTTKHGGPGRGQGRKPVKQGGGGNGNTLPAGNGGAAGKAGAARRCRVGAGQDRPREGT